LLFAVVAVRSARLPRPVAFLMVLSGLTYLAQGWTAGTEGLSQSHTNAIVLAEALNAAWMTWLLVFAWRMPDSKPASSHR
jgi:hypothetical protein